MPREYGFNYLEMFEIAAVCFEFSLIRCVVLCADERVRPAAAFSNVRQIEFVAVDDLVQMPPAMLR